jgi:RNA polymerase sigma-70 factor, ECF subfamily
MRTLTPTERTAFVLRHFEEKSIDEIAAAMSVRAGTAKQSIFRAVAKVRRALEPALRSAR